MLNISIVRGIFNYITFRVNSTTTFSLFVEILLTDMLLLFNFDISGNDNYKIRNSFNTSILKSPIQLLGYEIRIQVSSGLIVPY